MCVCVRVGVCACVCVCVCVRGCVCVCLVSEVPQSDGGVVTGGDAEIFSRMSSQTPDSSPSVTVQQQVGRRVLLPDLDDLAILRPHQDLTLRTKRRRREMRRTEGGRPPRDEGHDRRFSPFLCRQIGRTPPAVPSPAGTLDSVSSLGPRASRPHPPSS